MDTYVVRIYRRAKRASSLVLGVVEQVGTNGALRFSNFDELQEILCKGNERRRRLGTEPATPSEEENNGSDTS